MNSKVIKQFPIEEEYKKNTGVTPEDVMKLRQWLDTQPHLPGQHITDLDLALVFHCCDHSTAVSKELIDLHYTLKTLFTSFFKDRRVDEQIMKTLDYVIPVTIEMRAYDGSAIAYGRLVDYSVKNFVFRDAIKVMLMALDLGQYEEGTWPGMVLVIDMEGITLGHVARLDLQNMQQFLYFLQEALLVKIKGLHFLNAPSFVDKVLMLMRPFLKKELLDIIEVHTVGSKTIEKWVPIEGFLVESGGKYKTIKQAQEYAKAWFKAGASFFEAENQKRVVEARRPGRPKTISDIFGGVEGSFKKLDID